MGAIQGLTQERQEREALEVEVVQIMSMLGRMLQKCFNLCRLVLVNKAERNKVEREVGVLCPPKVKELRPIHLAPILRLRNRRNHQGEEI